MNRGELLNQEEIFRRLRKHCPELIEQLGQDPAKNHGLYELLEFCDCLYEEGHLDGQETGAQTEYENQSDDIYELQEKVDDLEYELRALRRELEDAQAEV